MFWTASPAPYASPGDAKHALLFPSRPYLLPYFSTFPASDPECLVGLLLFCLVVRQFPKGGSHVVPSPSSFHIKNLRGAVNWHYFGLSNADRRGGSSPSCTSCSSNPRIVFWTKGPFGRRSSWSQRAEVAREVEEKGAWRSIKALQRIPGGGAPIWSSWRGRMLVAIKESLPCLCEIRRGEFVGLHHPRAIILLCRIGPDVVFFFGVISWHYCRR